MSDITIPTFTEDVSAHQNLDDQPSLSAAQLKAAWDKPANDIKDFLNQTLKPVLESMASAINGLDTTIGNKISAKWEERYHVGSEIISSVNTNPATYLGFGTWELTGKGKVMVGVDPNVTKFNSGGKTGGAFSKTLEAANIPKLNLSKQVVTDVSANTVNTADLTFNGTVVTGVSKTKEQLSVGNNSPTALDITPSFETVYIFKRTA